MDKLEIIEGMLYLSGDEGLSIHQISDILEVNKKEATELMDTLTQKYSEKELQGLQLVCFGGIYKLSTNPKYHEYYAKMMNTKEAVLSNAALETLAIIAYNQPITRTGIEEIRGVGSDAMVRKLEAKALIKQVGREESPGRPILYGVTDEFMDAFHLTTLAELPPLEDIVDIETDTDIFESRYREGEDDVSE